VRAHATRVVVAGSTREASGRYGYPHARYGENQQRFPQHAGQKSGAGLPIVRLIRAIALQDAIYVREGTGGLHAGLQLRGRSKKASGLT
jgi:hypothetical protein